MSFVDTELKCTHCGAEFVFTAGEREFFKARGFTYTPKSCRQCRSKAKQRPVKVDFTVNCADCGAATTVPFIPRQDRPVYCRSCFVKHRSTQA